MKRTYIKPWFIQQMKELVELEEKILSYTREKIAGRSAYYRQRKMDLPIDILPNFWNCLKKKFGSSDFTWCYGSLGARSR